MAKLSKKEQELGQQIDELTADLQRTRADFENFRKRTEEEKTRLAQNVSAKTILQILPIIDDIRRATNHLPSDLSANKWALGVTSLNKKLDNLLASLNVQRIAAHAGDLFDPQLHEAVSVDEDSVGEQEVVAEELLAGYKLNGQPIRSAMVKVKRQDLPK